MINLININLKKRKFFIQLDLFANFTCIKIIHVLSMVMWILSRFVSDDKVTKKHIVRYFELALSRVCLLLP